MKHSAVTLVAAAVLFAGAVAARAADFTVPPVPHRYVTDDAGALDDSTRAAVEAELKSYEQQTGHQIIVWIGETTGDVPLETWTAETAHTWKIGHKGRDDGAVLFLFMRDHRVRIEVGYGLEGALPDATAKSIIDDNIVPAMKAHDANRAVTDGVNAIVTTITPSFASTTPAESMPPESGESTVQVSGAAATLVFVVFFGGFVLMLLLVGYAVRHAKRGVAGAGGWVTSSGSSDDDSSSSSDDDFDSGGGDFGGGGASGSW